MNMICPYNGFRECDWNNCAARMWIADKQRGGAYLMKVCAIAYNGGTVPKAEEPNKEK